jgi:hypothetical protein
MAINTVNWNPTTPISFDRLQAMMDNDTFLSGEVDGRAKGMIHASARTSAASGIAASEVTVLTTPSITLEAGRMYRASVSIPGIISISESIFEARLYLDSTQLQASRMTVATLNNSGEGGTSMMALFNANAGTYVFTVRFVRVFGIDTGSLHLGTDKPIYLGVEDVGLGFNIPAS